MENKIIAYSGTHGTGKTTSVYELAHKLKMEGLKVGIILEAARECPYPIFTTDNAVVSKEAQLWCFTRQINTELSMAKDFDIVISDRSAVDAVAYTIVAGHIDLAGNMINLLESHVPIYKEIRFKVARNNPYQTDDGLRSLDSDLRMKVEQTMVGLFKRLCVNLIWC